MNQQQRFVAIVDPFLGPKINLVFTIWLLKTQERKSDNTLWKKTRYQCVHLLFSNQLY